MAYLYIDRLKSDFQRSDFYNPRTIIYKRWCPQIITKYLNSENFDDLYVSENIQVKNSSMYFIPKVPKIFSIGLRLDNKHKDNINSVQFWVNTNIKKFLEQYFSFFLRYFQFSYSRYSFFFFLNLYVIIEYKLKKYLQISKLFAYFIGTE